MLTYCPDNNEVTPCKKTEGTDLPRDSAYYTISSDASLDAKFQLQTQSEHTRQNMMSQLSKTVSIRNQR